MAEQQVKQEVNTFEDDLNRLRRDVARLSEDLKKVVQVGAEAGRTKALDEFEQLYDQVKEGYESLRRETRRARTGLEREVEERPFTALLGAFIVGIVLGKFMSAR